MTCDSVAATAEQEPVPFYNAEDAKPAGENTEVGLHAEGSTAVMLLWERLSLRSSAGQQQELSALLGTDGHGLACKGLLGATVPCPSWLTPGHCCEVLLAALKHLQPQMLDNKVAFKAFASPPAFLLFRAPCHFYQGHVPWKCFKHCDFQFFF